MQLLYPYQLYFHKNVVAKAHFAKIRKYPRFEIPPHERLSWREFSMFLVNGEWEENSPLLTLCLNSGNEWTLTTGYPYAISTSLHAKGTFSEENKVLVFQTFTGRFASIFY